LNPELTIPASMLNGIVQYVAISSATAKRAVDEVVTSRAAMQKAASLAGPLLDYMVSAGVVAARQKQAAQAMLGGHAETLQLLKAAVDKIVEYKEQTKKADDNGEGVDPATLGLAVSATTGGTGPFTKEGAYDSLNDPFVGRRTSLVKQSDRALLAQIGK
jgi:hypothetical protein